MGQMHHDSWLGQGKLPLAGGQAFFEWSFFQILPDKALERRGSWLEKCVETYLAVGSLMHGPVLHLGDEGTFQ